MNATQTFEDSGSTVLVTLPCVEPVSNLDVESTTTSLCVRKQSGEVILHVPQLFSTVDASKTTWILEDDQLQICLHKLDSQLHWTEPAALEVFTWHIRASDVWTRTDFQLLITSPPADRRSALGSWS